MTKKQFFIIQLLATGLAILTLVIVGVIIQTLLGANFHLYSWVIGGFIGAAILVIKEYVKEFIL